MEETLYISKNIHCDMVIDERGGWRERDRERKRVYRQETSKNCFIYMVTCYNKSSSYSDTKKKRGSRPWKASLLGLLWV